MSTSVTVTFPPGSGLKPKQIKFKPTLLAHDAITEILTTNKISGSASQYVLALPGATPYSDTIWVEDNKTIASLPLGKSKDQVEIKKRYQVIRVRFRRGNQRVLASIDSPLSSIMAPVAKKFQIEKIEEFKLHTKNSELNLSKSIREQNLSTEQTFYLLGLDDDKTIEVNEDETQQSENEDSKEDSNTTAEDSKKKEEEVNALFNVPVKGITNVTKQGAVGIKHSYKKKFEPRYIVLKGTHLVIFKGVAEKKAHQVLNLSEFSLKESTGAPVDEKDSKSKRETKEISFAFELNRKLSAMPPATSGSSKRESKDVVTTSSSSGKKELTKGDSKEKPKEKEHKVKNLFVVRTENSTELQAWMGAVGAAMETATKETASKGSGGHEPAVFGAPLDKAVGSRQIPEIVEQCIKYITQKALKVVGIFRLSGSATQIDYYRKAFDSGEKVDLFKENDPHCVSGLLKLYFRLLPEPMLTFNLYHSFITAQCTPIRNLRIRYVRQLIYQLPKNNFNLLKTLIEFLRKVTQFSDVNKMGIPNLATVFGPNLLVSPDKSMITMIQDTPQINGIVNTLIEDYDHIFLNKEMDELVATAIYDYKALEPQEIDLKVGDIVKIISQGEDGWWSGEINGKIGQFPGSYVKVELKSKKEKFLEDMTNAKKKLEETASAVKSLQETKKKLESEIQVITVEREKFEKEIKALRDYVLTLFVEGRLENFMPKMEKYYGKIDASAKNRVKLDEARAGFKEEWETLEVFLKNTGSEARKALKPKTVEKMEGEMGLLGAKMNDEIRKRKVLEEKFNDLFNDLMILRRLLVPQ